MVTQKPVFPQPLKRGDTVGLFCPAGPVRKIDKFNAGIKLIRDAGFDIKVVGAYVNNSDQFLVSSDSERVRNLHILIEDPDVKAIMAIRGGFGSLRILPMINFDIIRRYPKLFIGFSDTTAMSAAILSQSGVISCHGPVLTSLADSDEQTRSSFFSLLTGELPETVKIRGVEILRAGDNATGRLLGGNLATLIHLMGTPWDLQYKDSILFLEDTHEAPYRLDRMLTHLAYAGRLHCLNGLILGSFDNGWDDKLQTIRLQEQVWTRVLELLAGTDFPVWGNFPIGHLEKNMALPFGLAATMDSSSASLKFNMISAQPW